MSTIYYKAFHLQVENTLFVEKIPLGIPLQKCRISKPWPVQIRKTYKQDRQARIVWPAQSVHNTDNTDHNGSMGQICTLIDDLIYLKK